MKSQNSTTVVKNKGGMACERPAACPLGAALIKEPVATVIEKESFGVVDSSNPPAKHIAPCDEQEAIIVFNGIFCAFSLIFIGVNSRTVPSLDFVVVKFIGAT